MAATAAMSASWIGACAYLGYGPNTPPLVLIDHARNSRLLAMSPGRKIVLGIPDATTDASMAR